MASEARASTGVAGLDEILGGGVPRDRLILVQGDPGVGKTTLALQFLLAGAAAGERTLYVTLAETRDELDAVGASHGWSLDQLAMYVQPPAAFSGDDNTLFHPSEVELNETTRAMAAEIDRVRPDRLVLDSASELRLLAESALRYRRQILQLKQFLAERRVTVLLLDDRTSDAGDLQLQSIAHGVIAMDQLVPLYGGERRRIRIVKMRALPVRGGYHDMTIETGGLRVFSRLVSSQHPETFEPGALQSGVAGLDELAGGGLPRGSSTLFVGPPGSGKSVVTTQYAIAAASRGENVAVFAFDESLHMIRARAAGLGMQLEGHPGRIDLFQVNPAEMSPGEFVMRVRQSVEVEGARVVVIDSLNGLVNAMPEEHFLILQLHELLGYLGRRGIVSLVVLAQRGLVGAAIDSPVDVSYIADTVFVMRHFEAAGRIRKAISVVKKRSGEHETSIREIRISAGGVSLGGPLAEFEGVLTGSPRFIGQDAKLLQLEGDSNER